MDSESALLNSAGPIVCGIFSIMMFLLYIGFPTQDAQEKISLVLKGVRPYKSDVAEVNFSESSLSYQATVNEALFSRIINEAAIKHGLDPALIKAIIRAESDYDPKATSKKGAVGLMQIMPDLASGLSIQDMYDPVYNINTGVEHLKFLLKEFEGNLELALAAYNAGSSKVHEYQGVPPYEATKNFVKEVFENYRYYQGV